MLQVEASVGLNLSDDQRNAVAQVVAPGHFRVAGISLCHY